MNTENVGPEQFIRKWIADLRSGQYNQGVNALRFVSQANPLSPKYCCLGVACETAKEFGIQSEGDFLSNKFPSKWFLGVVGCDPMKLRLSIPPHLRQKAKNALWVAASSYSPDHTLAASLLNDRAFFSFFEIAECIEHTFFPEGLDGKFVPWASKPASLPEPEMSPS